MSTPKLRKKWMKFDIFETDADLSVRVVNSNLGNLAEFGMVESSLELKNLVITRDQNISFFVCSSLNHIPTR